MPDSTVQYAGLTAEMPQGYRPDHFEDRMTFMESGALRSPMMIELWLAEEPPADVTRVQERTLSGRPVRYAEETREGGSGGPQHVLRAWRAAGGRTLLMEAKAQRESGKPDFDVAWQTFASARFEG